jgi:hypothetical protein
MTCHSPQCKGKNYFCYLCYDKITKAEHNGHFFGNPFSEKCLTTEARKN